MTDCMVVTMLALPKVNHYEEPNLEIPFPVAVIIIKKFTQMLKVIKVD